MDRKVLGILATLVLAVLLGFVSIGSPYWWVRKVYDGQQNKNIVEHKGLWTKCFVGASGSTICYSLVKEDNFSSFKAVQGFALLSLLGVVISTVMAFAWILKYRTEHRALHIATIICTAGTLVTAVIAACIFPAKEELNRLNQLYWSYYLYTVKCLFLIIAFILLIMVFRKRK